jgi:hypothetical protein
MGAALRAILPARVGFADCCSPDEVMGSGEPRAHNRSIGVFTMTRHRSRIAWINHVLAISCAVASLVTTSSSTAHAQLRPVGAQFQVNTYTTNQQRAVKVVALPDGGFFAVWDSSAGASPGNDTSDYSVGGQRYDAAMAPVGSSFQVNTYTTGFQGGPKIAVAPDGKTFVIWSSQGSPSTDTDAVAVLGQRFDSSGSPLGTEFQVNTYTTGGQSASDISAASDGSTIVIYDSDGSAGTDTLNGAILAQRYDATGAPLGTEFQVNSYTTGLQFSSSVSFNADGSFVAAWNSTNSAGGDPNQNIQARRFDSSANPVANDFQVNTYTTNSQTAPVVRTRSDGGFVVAWVNYNASPGGDNSQTSINARVFLADGTGVAQDFQVNTQTTGYQYRPRIAPAGLAGFIVQWTGASSVDDPDGFGVSARSFSSNGSPTSAEFTINTYTTSNQLDSDIARLPGGDYIATWSSFGSDETDTDGTSIQARRLAACDDAPIMGCLAAAKSSFQIKDNATDDSKDQMKWKWGNGDFVDQAMLGNPVLTTGYALCVYDEIGDSPSLVARAAIRPSALWVDKSPKGVQFKDKDADNDGVTKVQIKTGAATKSKAQLAAKGVDAILPTPVSLTQFLNIDSEVTVQLVADNGTCFSSTFVAGGVSKNDGSQFKAKAP